MRGLRLRQVKPLWSPSMSERSHDGTLPREILSALADGQAHSDEVARACGAWRQQPDARSTWHAYHLIGEAMRSPDQVAATDSAAFLARMRARLAEEPVVLSPQSAESVGRSAPTSMTPVTVSAGVQPLKRRMWAGPMAVAASFAVIVGVLTSNLGGPVAQPEGGQMARSGVGWAEGGLDAVGVASALGSGGSFSAARTQDHAWLPADPTLEQAMTVQRPQPTPPQTFAEVPGVIRVSAGQGR